MACGPLPSGIPKVFSKTTEGKVNLNLSAEERVLLVDLFNQMQNLLETPEVPEDADPLAALVGLDGPTQAPTDPAVARLFPAAYLDDQQAAQDFRRYTEPGLRSEKMQNLDLVSESLVQDFENYELTNQEANAWLKSLNDLRLVLGTRIGVSDEYREDETDDPGFYLYDYLTYLQGSLIDAL